MLFNDGHRPQENKSEAAGKKLITTLIFQLCSVTAVTLWDTSHVGLYEDPDGGRILSVFA